MENQRLKNVSQNNINRVKFNVALILTLIVCQACFGQTTDTIRVYVYLKPTDNWRIEVKKNKAFSLHNSLLKMNDFTAEGECVITDTTFQFLCDTSKLKNKNLVNDKLKQFSNLPFILTGQTFKRQNNFFIPHNINYDPEDSITMPKGIFARYYRGDFLSGDCIELRKDSTYTFYDRDDVSRFAEKGKWLINNDIITFIPNENKWSMIDWLADDRKLYLTHDYLIGKKTAKIYTKARKTIVTETYSYLSKEPNYSSDLKRQVTSQIAGLTCVSPAFCLLLDCSPG